MVYASAHSDDFVHEVFFDATLWFEQASDEEIKDLAICGWGGDYPADEVARYMARFVEPLEKMFDYLWSIGEVPSKRDLRGFECHVDEEEARKWLAGSRPHLLEDLALARGADD